MSKEWYKANKERHAENCKRWARQHPVKVKEIQKKFRDKHRDKLTEYDRKYRVTARGIYNYLSTRHRFPIVISKEDFCEWYNNQEKVCFYCGIPETLIWKFPKFFVGMVSPRLSIDRIDNNKGYESGNMVLACKRCNLIKSNFFSVEEMRKIAQEYLTPKWKEMQ